MKLKVLTPDQLILDQEVTSVTLPGTEGEMTILPKHTAMVATLKKGAVRYKEGNREVSGNKIERGFVEVLKDTVLVMTAGWQTSAGDRENH